MAAKAIERSLVCGRLPGSISVTATGMRCRPRLDALAAGYDVTVVCEEQRDPRFPGRVSREASPFGAVQRGWQDPPSGGTTSSKQSVQLHQVHQRAQAGSDRSRIPEDPAREQRVGIRAVQISDSATARRIHERVARVHAGHLTVPAIPRDDPAVQLEQPHAEGYAFEANSSLQATPARLAVQGTDTSGFTTLADEATTTSTDTPDEIRILISNYEVPPEARGRYRTGKARTR